MATTRLTIHIPPEASPETIMGLINVLSTDPDRTFDSVKSLLMFLEDNGVGSRTEIQSLASDMGLLDKSATSIKLTKLAHSLSRMRADVQPDILHFLLITGWDIDNPTAFLASWAYRYVCDQYWDIGKRELDDDYLNRQVEETINYTRKHFLNLDVGDFEEISFSRKSLRGSHNWLEALEPYVIEDKTFVRRSFCSPELLILVIGYVLRNEKDIINIDVLLSREKREAICRLCLLEPEALDKALDWAIPIHSNIISAGTSAGFYGRFIRLHKLPTLQDLVR